MIDTGTHSKEGKYILDLHLAREEQLFFKELNIIFALITYN